MAIKARIAARISAPGGGAHRSALPNSWKFWEPERFAAPGRMWHDRAWQEAAMKRSSQCDLGAPYQRRAPISPTD
jgi:hypothetical protein